MENTVLMDISLEHILLIRGNSMSERKQMFFWFVCLFIEILVFYSIIKDDIGIYCRNYYAVVNHADNNAYEAIIDANGSIKKKKVIERDEYKLEYVYYDDGRMFVFKVYYPDLKELCYIDITGEDYRFGRKKIGVGSSQKQIEAVYKGKNNKYYEFNKRIEVIESRTNVSFYFNEQDIVYKIRISKPEIY